MLHIGVAVPKNVYDRITELQESLSEEEITVKGYVKQLRKLINPFLGRSESKELTILDKQFKAEEITEKSFYNCSRKLLDSFVFKTEETTSIEPYSKALESQLSFSSLSSNEENDQTAGSNINMLAKSEVLRGDGNVEFSCRIKEEMEVDDGDAKDKTETSFENGFSEPSQRKKGLVKGKRSNRKKMPVSQPLITSSFSTCNKRRSLVEMNEQMDDSLEDSPERKRMRMKASEEQNIERLEKDDRHPIVQTPAFTRRCTICSQLLNSEELQLYPGHPEGAMDEFIALTDPKLSLFTGKEDLINDYDQQPQHKITYFNVYDKEGHICPFDSGLIEKNILLYFSGYIKPIYDENPSIEDGIPAKEMGPINEWWISGFDGGEKALIGFSTAFAEYVLMEPSELYTPYFEAVQEKIYMSKLVIELLVNNIEPSYEDLLLKVQTAVPPPGIPSFTEDSLLRHAQFICDQVHNFELAGEDEESLVSCSCIRSLMKLAGVTLGKRKASCHRGGKIKINKMPRFTKATTTPLVRNLFESFFTDQIAQAENANVQGPRRTRCGVCEVCQEPDCGNCGMCRDMVKFGGSGRGKQCCVNRRCPNMSLADLEESDDEEDLKDLHLEHLSTGRPSTRVHRIKKRFHRMEWIGDPIIKQGKKAYYKGLVIEGDLIRVGDCVMVEPDDPKIPVYIARVRALWEVEGRKEKLFHADWFCRGIDTILGETADPQELFLINDCEDTLLDAVLKKVTVIEYIPPSNWSSLGDIEDPDHDYPIKEKNDHTFFYQKWYHPELARFEDIPPTVQREKENDYNFCPSCLRIREEEAKEMCLLGKKSERVEGSLNQYIYENIKYFNYEYEVGDCAYVNPDALKFKVRVIPPTVEERKKTVDEVMYPEFYRKTSDRVKGSNIETPQPFRIVRILKITCKDSELKSVSPDDVRLRVAKFYRPENTHRGMSASFQADLNVLYWSEEEVTISLSSICGKCSVVFGENLQCSVDEFFSGGPNRFTFFQAYDADKKEFTEPPMKAQLLGGIGKGKGQSKGKAKVNPSRKEVKLETHPVINQKLKTLDVFAGSGGLSEGMHEAGVIETKWAIEVYEPAAQAFRLNNPEATVFTDDCNILLKLVMEGERRNEKGQKLPQKGEVDMLCGGPPCQGFSGMNRFNSRQYSQFKNSLVASFLSFCDFYRPKYFLLENVRNFVSYKCSMVLKLTLRVLLKMGYQCTVGILQAGNYGIAQTRRRAIVLAAAPGEILPLYPEPLTTFSPRACQLSIVVDNKKYASNCQWLVSAPFRTITVRDTLSDLQDIKNGAKKDQISYGSEPESHFQRLIRGNQYQPLLRDHICKEMTSLVEARMRNIPTAPGSDWRDLPNINIRLADGTFSKVLLYIHNDKKNGRSSTGALRGVCSCALGKACDPMDKQFNTLIPWCLPHTGNRHNHWSGLYGRLEWDGFFSTTVTNPEPMGKQGRVLHPEQNRVVSVRECARSQGFPDTYRFYGSILEKHRQIGNAVPPPMAKAIGLEIKKAVGWKLKKDGKMETS